MKYTGVALAALLILGGGVLAAGCIGSAAEQSPVGSWILVSTGSGSSSEHPMGVITLEVTSEEISGSAGVNSYHGTVVADPATGAFTIGPVGTTRMAGPENMMIQEEKYLAALANVTGYSLANGYLNLVGSDGSVLLSFAQMPVSTLSGSSWISDESVDVTISFAADGSFNGQGPVNLYFGTWYVTGANGVTFGPVGSTLMAGPEELMTAESEFFAALDDVAEYTIQGESLSLLDAAGKTLLSFTQTTDIATENILYLTWTLTGDDSVTLNLSEDGSFNGQGPVNLYFGSYTLSADGALAFGPVGSTLMAGPDELMTAETAFFAALEEVHGYHITDGLLSLTNADGETLLSFE